jgi:RNA polymerase sigma-70 factor (ECF subfamily)
VLAIMPCDGGQHKDVASASPSLSPHLLDAIARPEARDEMASGPDLEARLAGLLADGRAAWPEVAVPDDAFMRHLGERLPVAGARAALAATHAGDLYLACACLRGDPAALVAFEERFMRRVSKYLTRADVLPGLTDDVKQLLRGRLFTGVEGLRPSIGSYTGRGPLAAWLRTVAVRAALELRRSQPGALAGDEQVAALAAAGPDPELSFLKTHAAAELKAAFEQTLARLSVREANIVRLYFLDGVTMTELASVYRVSVRTIERWIARLRVRLLKDTRRRLAERLRLPASELDELIEVVRSQLHVSMRRFLNKSKA